MTMQIFAHRGSSARYAEHTRAAYFQALADGADGVECDLHLTADGALVLIHDDSVERTSNGTGPVAEHTLAHMRELDFSAWKGAAIPPEYGSVSEQLLTLAELLKILAAAGREVALAIEFKYGEHFDVRLVDAALAVLDSHGWTAAGANAGNVDVTFMSFHPEAVRYLAGRVPASTICQLLEQVEPSAASLLHRAQEAGEALLDDGVAHLAGPGTGYLRAHPGNAARWLAEGRALRVWTVDTEEDLQLCLAAGVSQVTTNRPAEIKAMLVGSGEPA